MTREDKILYGMFLGAVVIIFITGMIADVLGKAQNAPRPCTEQRDQP